MNMAIRARARAVVGGGVIFRIFERQIGSSVQCIKR